MAHRKSGVRSVLSAHGHAAARAGSIRGRCEAFAHGSALPLCFAAAKTAGDPRKKPQ